MSRLVDGGKIVGIIVTVLLGTFLLAMLLAFPTKWLWNWLMPDIFGLTTITVWQAWGLSFLSGLFFKGTTSSN